MREFTTAHRFSFRSLPEITEQVDTAIAKIKSRRSGVNGKFSREIAFNSVFLYFANLSLDEQLRIFDAGVSDLVPLLDQPADPVSPESQAQVPLDVQDVPSPKRKRRS